MRRRLKTIETGVAGAIRGKAVWSESRCALRLTIARAAAPPEGRTQPMCRTPAVNNKRHASVCATRLSGAWRWPARSKKGKTPSALAFRGPSVDSLYMVELKLDVN